MASLNPDHGPAGTPATERRDSRPGRFILSTLLVALVVATGAGIAAFALQGGFAAAAAPTDASTAAPASAVGRSVDCGLSSRCIPELQATEVVRQLEGRGFFCEQSSGDWFCDLHMGATSYHLQMSPENDDDDHRLTGITGSVSAGPDSDLASIAVPYLTWVAALPFGNDPAGVQVMEWAKQQIQSGEDSRARIGGYEYAVSPGRLELDALLGFEDELWSDT
jgi:hypothetical protein